LRYSLTMIIKMLLMFHRLKIRVSGNKEKRRKNAIIQNNQIDIGLMPCTLWEYNPKGL
jgi:hypothetical protein